MSHPNKVKRPNKITVRVSDLELLALESLTGDGKLSKTIRRIIHTSRRYKDVYHNIQSIKKRGNE